MFDHIINRIINAEGDYSDHPSDKGGPTRFGITQAVARANGYFGDMRQLPLSVAQAIYVNRYVKVPGFDRVALVDTDLGLECVDTGVNMGPHVAAVFFQRCLNVFNKQGSKYADVFVDGRIGPVTIEALGAFLAWRGDKGKVVLLKALNSLQGHRYIDIAERNPSQEDFAYGWFERVEIPHA